MNLKLPRNSEFMRREMEVITVVIASSKNYLIYKKSLKKFSINDHC